MKEKKIIIVITMIITNNISPISVYRPKSPFCRKAGGGLSNKTILFFYCAYFCNVIIKQNIQQSKNNKKPI